MSTQTLSQGSNGAGIADLIAWCQIELVNPDREWQVDNMWLTTQRGLDVRLSRREKAQ